MLREWLPALTSVYGIKPWELELLTSGEIDEYLKQLPRRRPSEE